MAKVSYKQGLKSTYLSLPTRDPNALYFCTDTKELFRGDDLYSDGVRFVSSYGLLPDFSVAADGILYFCEDLCCGYVLNDIRNKWICVIHGVDNETIAIDDKGLAYIKKMPLEIETVGNGNVIASIEFDSETNKLVLTKTEMISDAQTWGEF